MPEASAVPFSLYGLLRLRDTYVHWTFLAAHLLIHLQLSTAPLARQSPAWRPRPRAFAAPVLISAVSQSRLASTSAATTPSSTVSETASAAASSAPVEPTFSGSDVISAVTPDLANMPEQIGYLKAIGIDYGLGPTSMIEWILEHVHVYSGLPWWGSIVTTALLIRVGLFPLVLKSSDVGARQAAMAPLTKPINDRLMAAFAVKDAATVQQCREELKRVYARSGVSPTSLLFPMLSQGVVGYCTFKLMRAMANLPVPGLETGGFGWITDLTQSDPYYLLPALMAASLHIMFRFGGESGVAMQQSTPGMRTLMLYVFPGVMFTTMSWLPANLAVWFSVTGLTGIVQARALQLPRRRSPNTSTIDVAGTSRAYSASSSTSATSASKPSGSGLHYQAPNIRTTASPTSSTSSRTASTVAPQPVPEKPAFLERAKDSVVGQVNAVGQSWENVLNQWKTQRAAISGQGPQKPGSRSKEFLARANAYEKKYGSSKKN
ncbi:hypothetical protein H2203_001656 [Taxawa tesnikishii (nom. ined.)]|nr:hypothetical protein H2203_001656 [Dothideales sp. JES 119]